MQERFITEYMWPDLKMCKTPESYEGKLIAFHPDDLALYNSPANATAIGQNITVYKLAIDERDEIIDCYKQQFIYIQDKRSLAE